jgi:hypothetical protein
MKPFSGMMIFGQVAERWKSAFLDRAVEGYYMQPFREIQR